MVIHTLKQALMQESVSLTRHRIDLISGLVCALAGASAFGQSEKTRVYSCRAWLQWTVTIAAPTGRVS